MREQLRKRSRRLAIIGVCLVALFSIVYAADLVSPYQTSGRSAGDRIAQGDAFRVKESNLVHVDSGGGDELVNKGDAVLFGTGITSSTLGGLVGVAYTDASGASDYVTVERQGIYVLPVAGITSLVYGQKVYIHPTTGVLSDTGTISADGSDLLCLFGYSLSETEVTTTSSISIFTMGGD